MRFINYFLISLFFSLLITYESKSQDEAKDYFYDCMKGKIKYPLKLQLMKIEGRVIVELKTNEKGYVEKLDVKADYFGKSDEYEPFTDSSKIERLRVFVSKKIIPTFTNCAKNHQFGQKNYTFAIPVSFGIYGYDDDYTIYDDDDYEYDYQEQYDFGHEYD